MQKKLVIIAIVSLLFIAALLLTISNSVGPESKIKPQPVISPTTVPFGSPPQTAPLKIISTNPADGAQNVSLDASVEITFNRRFNLNEIAIQFLDASVKSVNYQPKIKGSVLIIEPSDALAQSTVYTLFIRNQQWQILKEFGFLTQTVAPGPDTRPIAALTKTIERTRRERPDIYLANQLPHQSFDFNMVLEIDNQGYFEFIVTSSRLSGSILKDRVEQWLLSLKLTQKQIADLPITYP